MYVCIYVNIYSVRTAVGFIAAISTVEVTITDFTL